MKKIYFVLFVLCQFVFVNAYAFGDDKNIMAFDSLFNVTYTDIEVAPNGYLFAVRTFENTNNEIGQTAVCFSIDSGQTWRSLYGTGGDSFRISAIDIAVTPVNSNTIYLFCAFATRNLDETNYTLRVERFRIRFDSIGTPAILNAFNATVIKQASATRKVNDIQLASSSKAILGTNVPYTVGILYSCHAPAGLDSVNFLLSVDSGATYIPKNVHVSAYLRKVSIAYGNSASQPEGMYFFAWERMLSPNGKYGNVFASHTIDSVNGQIYPTHFLDGNVDINMLGKCRNPRIAASYGGTDNDSAAITAIVLADYAKNGYGSNNDIVGFYNKRSAVGDWQLLNLASSLRNEMQADVVFNRGTNQFLATYLDSTNGIMPLLSNSINLTNPNGWPMLSLQYNDFNAGLNNAFPHIAINPINNGAALAWTQGNFNNRSVGLFDANYLNYAVNTTNTSICASEVYPFNDQLLNASGAYYDTIQTSAGDSIIRLNLSVVPYRSHTIDTTICEGSSYRINGVEYRESGTYYDTIQTITGCDTLLVINLLKKVISTAVVSVGGYTVLTSPNFTAYQWRLNGIDIPGATSSSYNVTQNGTYDVWVTENGCTKLSESVVYNYFPVGIEDTKAISFSLYPNPAATQLNLNLTNEGNANLCICNIEGAVIFQSQISAKNTIDVSKLSQGIYILRVEQNGLIETIRFAKL